MGKGKDKNAHRGTSPLIGDAEDKKSENARHGAPVMLDDMDCLADTLVSKMQVLIDLVEDLHHVGIESVDGFDLPRIVVVGEQSSGKVSYPAMPTMCTLPLTLHNLQSSVLESLVGFNVLPTAGELATRRPLYLKLKRTPNTSQKMKIGNSLDDMELAENAEDLMLKIQSLTDEVAGDRGNIIDEPIYVTVSAHACPDLTVVDLPGIAKNKLVDSEQPEDIEKVTTDLIRKYIAPAETVILAVIPANMDAAASDAIKVARSVDPDMKRTIGVITKLDMVPDGTSVISLLQGKYVRLELGAVGVRNRSQKECEDGMTVKEALRREQDWIQGHAEFSTMNPSLFGAKSLTMKLMSVLGKRIQETLPVLKENMAARLDELEERLMTMGNGPPETVHEQYLELNRLIKIFSQDVIGTVKGTKLHQDKLDASELIGSSLIRHRFSEFAMQLEQEHNINNALNDKYLRDVITSSHGSDLPGFDSFDAFRDMVTKHHAKLLKPSLACAEDIVAHIRDEIVNLCLSSSEHYPILQLMIHDKAVEIVDHAGKVSEEKINDQISMFDYVFSSDQEFVEIMSFSEIVEEVVQRSFEHDSKARIAQAGHNSLIDRTETSVESMRKKLIAYDKIIRRNTIQAIPQVIGRWVIIHLEKQMELELMAMIVSSDESEPKLDEILCEHPSVKEHRKTTIEDIKKIKDALRVLRGVNNMWALL